MTVGKPYPSHYKAMKKTLCIWALLLSLQVKSQDDEGILRKPWDGESLLPVDAGITVDPGDGDVAVPVDGGLSLLLAAGAAYGVRRVRHRRVAK